MLADALQTLGLVLVVGLLAEQFQLSSGERELRWRQLQAVPGALSPQRLAELQVPPGTEFLFLLVSDCPKVLPPQVRGRMATLCPVVINTRSCLGLENEDPQFYFSCTKEGCEPILLSNEETVCIWKAIGVDLSGTNETLETRCNVPVADAGLFEERQLPFYQSIAANPVSNCFEGQGPGAVVTNQIICIDEKPQLQIKWIIPFLNGTDGDKEFTCLLNRQCINGMVEEFTFCFENNASWSRANQIWCLFMSLWLLLIVLM